MIYLIFSAITPVVIFLYLIYRKDMEKEPWKRLCICFAAGVISIIPIVVIEWGLMSFAPFQSSFCSSLYDAFVIAAIPEESVKFVLLYWLVWKSRDFDQYYDGIVYAVFISLGFACIENILYVVQNGYGVAFMRAILSIPLHGLCGVIMGYFFALARFSRVHVPRFRLWLSFLLAMLAHGLFDFFLMYMDQAGRATTFFLFVLFVVLMIFLWKTGLRKIKEHVERDRIITQERTNNQEFH